MNFQDKDYCRRSSKAQKKQIKMTLQKLPSWHFYWVPVFLYLGAVILVCLVGLITMAGKNYTKGQQPQAATDEESPDGKIDLDNETPEKEVINDRSGPYSDGENQAEEEKPSIQTQVSTIELVNGEGMPLKEQGIDLSTFSWY